MRSTVQIRRAGGYDPAKGRAHPDNHDPTLEPYLTAAMVRRAHLLDDEVLVELPIISAHDDPQDSPRQYDCGCVAIQRTAERGLLGALGLDQRPYEMRLAVPCRTKICEAAHRTVCDHDNRVHYLGGGLHVCFACWAHLLFGRA